MSTIRKNSDIFKGSMLQVAVNGNILGFATSHSLSITVNTSEVTTKDHGDYPGIVKQNTTWEVACENLFCQDNWNILEDLVNSATPVNITFCDLENYPVGSISRGIVQSESGETVQPTSWTRGKHLASGDAYLTSFNVNAAAGDNATISATFTGAGPLTYQNYVGPTPTGPTGPTGETGQG